MNSTAHASTRCRARPAFTLVEVLVCIAVIAILIALLFPALSAAREAGRSTVCLSNQRQSFIACRAYADDYRGLGPAIGQPYAELPNWALVVQTAAGRAGTTTGELYTPVSALVCPTIAAAYGQAGAMTRTYAMNATGHAGQPRPDGTTDPDNFDTAPAMPGDKVAQINFDRVERPSQTPLLVDSASDIPGTTDAPPPTRTASVLDFRQAAHVANRLGRFHGGRGAGSPGGAGGLFNGAMFDGSARRFGAVPDWWRDPLP